MNTYLDHTELTTFRKDLMQRLEIRREDVRQVLIRSDEEQFQTLAGAVNDEEDRSLADLLVDVNLAEVDRHIDEIRAIEAALLRIAEGGYGICTDCEDEIGRDRLRVEPATLRCAECQARYERTYAQPGHPKL
jgi:RNA polymerase-binding transcription factor DksA